MLKIRFLTVLAALCGLLAPLPTSAATLSFTGRIDGYAIPGNPDLSTLDFYFITALSDIQVSASMVVVSTPSVVNTVLDMSFFHPPNSEGDVLPYHTVLGNSSESFMLFAGDYIVAMRPRNSDFDGYWPLPAFANNDSPFDSFDYQAALTGDVRLNEIWRGRRDGTFDVTIVPEPNTCFTLILGGLIMTRRRRRKKPVHRSAWCVLPAILIAMTAGVGRADDGVLTWPSTAGMGYRLQRSMRPGLPSGPWLNLPITYLGTGGEITHRCFGLPPSTPSTGSEAVYQYVPLKTLTVWARRDGSALLNWTQDGAAVATYVIPPPSGTSATDAGKEPFFDLRTSPGTLWNAVTNPLRNGAIILPPLRHTPVASKCDHF